MFLSGLAALAAGKSFTWAPSHVSALMSGIMIKMGIYGLLPIITLLGRGLPWAGHRNRDPSSF